MVGKLFYNAATFATTAKLFILEMIKAVLKAAILWACSASAVSTCRIKGSVEWANRDWVQMPPPPPRLAETGGMFEQQRTNWKKTRQVWAFPPQYSERFLHWFAEASSDSIISPARSCGFARERLAPLLRLALFIYSYFWSGDKDEFLEGLK